jgi:4a-hydroxytetrahydrobiopterin dehydratase
MATKGKPRTPLLLPRERREAAKRVPKWRITGKRLMREATMRDFDAAWAFLGEVAELARRADHHPDLHLTDYKEVRMELSSHDAGGLTERDFSLAEEIDHLPGAWSERARAEGAAPAARRPSAPRGDKALAVAAARRP